MEAADRLVPTLSDSIRGAGGADVTRGLYAALGDPAKKPAALLALQSLVHKLGDGNQMSASSRDFIVRTRGTAYWRGAGGRCSGGMCREGPAGSGDVDFGG